MCKKIVALVLALVMMLSVLAACNNEKPNETTQPKETQGNQPAETKPQETEDPGITFPLSETLEVTLAYVNGNIAFPIAENYTWNKLQELANIKFDVTEFDGSEIKEKGTLLLSGGNYPQVLFKCNQLDMDKFGADGLLIELDELIRECCPNLCAVLDERNGWSSITSPDGHIYSLPQIVYTRQDGGMASWINTRWLENVGMDMPTTKEEFYEVLKAFKEQDANGNGDPNDEIPWLPQAGSQIASIIGMINIFGDAGQWMQTYWCVQDGEMVYLPTTEYFKEDWIKFLKKLYDEGLMHPDSFTIKSADVNAICKSGDDTVGIQYGSSTSRYSDLGTWNEWATIKPFNVENYTLQNGITAKALAFTDKCDEETVRILLTWADQFYTEEGGRIGRMGIEGETYSVNADGTYTTFEDKFENHTYQATLLGSGAVPYLEPELYRDGATDPEEKHVNQETVMQGTGLWTMGTVMPTLTYTEDETDERKALWTDINSYVRNYVAECVTGVIDVDATWTEFQATLETMGVERLIEITDGSYQRAIGG